MAERAGGRLASPLFVGRRAELAALETALAQAGRVTATLVGGEAGAGKTRLVGEFRAAAVAAGTRVVTGAGVALGAENLPYAPFMDALRDLAASVGVAEIEAAVGPSRADLARLLPELRHPGDEHRPAGAADRSVLFQAVARALEAAAATAPLVVVLEDLHWADTSSRELLAFLLGRLQGPVLLVATYRSDEVHRTHPMRPLLAQAARSERVVRVDLPPLTPEEVAQQMEAIADAKPPPAAVDAVVARAEGNPFFVEELVAAGGGEELPPDLAEVLTARLASLPPAAHELVTVAAVAGRRVGHDLLVAAARPDVDVDAGLREAVSRHVIVADGAGNYTFRHALLQEAAYDELLPAERKRLHAAYAGTLAHHPEWATTSTSAAGELAHHYLAAADHPRALATSVQAAGAASEAYAFAEAHALYEQALELWERVPQAREITGCLRAELLQQAADAALLAGAAERAVTLVRAALDDVDPGTAPTLAALLQWRLARLLWLRGEGPASLAAHRTALSLVPSEPSAERALLLAAEGRVLMLALHYRESAARCEEAICVARAAGARREEGDALNTLGVDLSRLAQPERAVELLEQSLAIAEEVGSVEDVWRAYINLAAALDIGEELGRVAEVASEGVTRLERLGYAEGAATLRCVRAMALMTAGAWDEADRLAAETLAGAPLEVNWLQANEVRGMIAQRRGAFAAAHTYLGEARRICSKSYPGFLTDVLAAMTELALAEGRVADARALVDEGLDALAGTEDQSDVLLLVHLGLRAEADDAARGGREAAARRRQAQSRAEHLMERATALGAGLASRGIPLPRRGDVLYAQCEAERGRALGCSDPGLWKTAVEEWDRISHPFEAAYACWRLAEAHLAAGSKPEAATALHEAFSGASRLGARWLVTEVEALGRRARIRLRTVTPRGDPAATARPFGLTDREAEVLGLLAAGRTNRQIAGALFMSEKTASVHVSRILTKLGVANRGQAAALAHRMHLSRDSTSEPVPGRES